jgi:hypothetical protein
MSWKPKPCRWCGGERKPGGGHGKGNRKFQCYNPDCPRKHYRPWRVPVMAPLPPLDALAYRNGEDDPGFENAVRAMEDFLS